MISRKNRKRDSTRRAYSPINNVAPTVTTDRGDVDRRPTTVRYVIYFVLLLVAAYAIWWGWEWLFTPAATHIRGTINSTEFIETSYSNTPENGISPACGCMRPSEKERGIGFFSTDLEISNGNDHGGFTFFANLPEKISLIPELSFEGTIFQFKLDDNERLLDRQHEHMPKVWRSPVPSLGFSPHALLNDSYKNAKIVSVFRFRDAYALHLLNVRDIKINQLGIVPFVAWNPVKDSRVSLSLDRESGDVDLTELADAMQPAANGTGDSIIKKAVNEAIHPVMDFVGVPLIIWTEDSTSIVLDGRPITQVKSDQYRHIVTVIVLKAAFSMRMVSLSSTSLSIPHTRLFMQIAKDSFVEENHQAALDTDQDFSKDLSNFLGRSLLPNEAQDPEAVLFRKKYVFLPITRPIDELPRGHVIDHLWNGTSEIGAAWNKNVSKRLEGDQLGLINVSHLITKRNNTKYHLTALLSEHSQQQIFEARAIARRHTSIGRFKMLGKPMQMEFFYPRLGGAAVIFRGPLKWIRMGGVQGSVQLGSTIHDLPGSNDLLLSYPSYPGHPLPVQPDLNSYGGFRINGNVSQVIVNGNQKFRNLDKYEWQIRVASAVLAFLGIAKLADFLGLLSQIRLLLRGIFSKFLKHS